MKLINSKEILSALDALSDSQKKEVFDFVESLMTRKAKEKKRELVKRVYGLTKGSKLTSELFSKMKFEEMALEHKM